MGSTMPLWSCLAGLSTANKPGIETAGDGDIGRALHQRPPVGEKSNRIVASLKTQQELVEVHFSMRFQAALHLGKIYRAMMFMDLHRISSAQRDLGTIFTAEIGKVPPLAHRALRLRAWRR